MKKICLNIGCGKDIKEGYVNIDREKGLGIDKTADFNKEHLTDFYDIESVDEIFCSHFIEHLVNPVEFIFDCLSVLKKGGIINVILPNTPIPQLYHFGDLHGLSYFNCLETKLDSNQSIYDVEDESSSSNRHNGIKRVIIRNIWYFRDWFLRRFYDETTYIIKKQIN